METPTEKLTLETSDSLKLEAELRVPSEVQSALVVAHPHPQHGGFMQSIVPGALFQSLPETNTAVLRFNFRGIGNSEGSFGNGEKERLDVVAAVDALYEITEGVPFVLAGSSFGADMALTVNDERISGWFAVAPPLREYRLADMKSSTDSRPKMLLVPQLDEFQPPDSAQEVTAKWRNTSIEVIPGADHYLVGRMDNVVELARAFITKLLTDERN